MISYYDIISTLCEKGYKAYLIGGAVRDLFQGIEIDDFDISTNATPNDLMRIFNDCNVGTVGKSFGVTLIDGIEVSTFQIRHPFGVLNGKTCDTEFVDDLEIDVMRRDFTINALALCNQTGDIIDYVGGISDLKNNIIRFVGNPKDRIFEDPDRIIRACRFLAKIDGVFENETLKALRQYSYLIKDHVRPERIRLEVFKALKIKKASIFFKALHKIGALRIIFPSLDRCFAHPHGKHHGESVFDHMMFVGDFISIKTSLVKLAGYFHDVGKPISYDLNDETFFGHEYIGSDLMDIELSSLRFSSEERKQVTNLIHRHMLKFDDKKGARRIINKLDKVGIKVSDFIRLKRADHLGNLNASNNDLGWIRLLTLQMSKNEDIPFSIKHLVINGNDVMKQLNILPGPNVGKILKLALEEVLENPECNNREYLLKFISLVRVEENIIR